MLVEVHHVEVLLMVGAAERTVSVCVGVPAPELEVGCRAVEGGGAGAYGVGEGGV